MEPVFEQLVNAKIKTLRNRLEMYLGKQKFNEVLTIYENYDESDIDFKTNVESRA